MTYKEQLRALLIQRLQMEEVKTLYFALDLDEENQTSQAKAGLVRELIRRVEQYGLFDKLEIWIEENRPDISLAELINQSRKSPQRPSRVFLDETPNNVQKKGPRSNLKYVLLGSVGSLAVVFFAIFMILNAPTQLEVINQSSLPICYVDLFPHSEDGKVISYDMILEYGDYTHIYDISYGYYDIALEYCDEDVQLIYEFRLDLNSDYQFVVNEEDIQYIEQTLSQ